jgi:lipopolysaccharide export LptBFGC system permease protein LptF
LIPAALLLALLAVAMGGRHNRLGAIAAGVGALCFAVGMAVAVITGNPIY